MAFLEKYSRKLRFVIAASVIGNTMEWLDFYLISLLAPLFTHLFFAPNTGTNFLSPLFFIALVNIARPFGGIVFGYFGDKIGRKPVIIATVLCMTLLTLCIAFLPTFSMIGNKAQLILCIICILQGFCIGGEFPGSLVFLVESAPKNLKSYAGTWAYFGAMAGILIGSIELTSIVFLIPSEEFVVWGWRLPFIIGAVVGLIAYHFRRSLHETPIFQKESEQGKIIRNPFPMLIKKYKMAIFKGLMIFISDAIGFNIALVFCSFYLTNYLKVPIADAFPIHIFSIVCMLVFLPFGGKLSDIIGPIPMAKYALTFMIVFAFPLYLMMDPQALWTIYLAQGVLTLLHAMYLSNFSALACKIFPSEIRYTGVAIIINLA